jgi:hypothetical protein
MRVEANELGGMRLEAELLLLARHGALLGVDSGSCVGIMNNSGLGVVSRGHSFHLV